MRTGEHEKCFLLPFLCSSFSRITSAGNSSLCSNRILAVCGFSDTGNPRVVWIAEYKRQKGTWIWSGIGGYFQGNPALILVMEVAIQLQHFKVYNLDVLHFLSDVGIGSTENARVEYWTAAPAGPCWQ